MASLGTISITGPSSFVIGEAQTFTATITSKLDSSVLTWEGVGFDLYDSATGGLTGDQDHDEAITLTFTTPGEYSIKAGYSDEAVDNSPQYSENYVLTVSEPVEPGEPLTMKTESVLSGDPFLGSTHSRLLLVLLRVGPSLTPRFTPGKLLVMVRGMSSMALLV